jgi:hypothetical protein
MKALKALALGVMTTVGVIGTNYDSMAQTGDKTSYQVSQSQNVQSYNIETLIIRYDTNTGQVTEMRVSGWKRNDDSNAKGLSKLAMKFRTDRNAPIDPQGNNNALFINKLSILNTNSNYATAADVDFSIKSPNKDAFIVVPEPSAMEDDNLNMPYSIKELNFKGRVANLIFTDPSGKPISNTFSAAARLKEDARVYGIPLDRSAFSARLLTESDAETKNRQSTYQENIYPAYTPVTSQDTPAPRQNNNRPRRGY